LLVTGGDVFVFVVVVSIDIVTTIMDIVVIVDAGVDADHLPVIIYIVSIATFVIVDFLALITDK
jgi:hypothetical protein